MARARNPENRHRALIALSFILLGLFLVWAHFTRLDLVTRGTGRVVTISQNRVVQSPVAGSIDALYVTTGQFVTAGTALADINPTEAVASLEETRKRLKSLNIQKLRLDAEAQDLVWDGSVALQAAAGEGAAAQALIEAQIEVSRARHADLEARLATLLQTRLQRERELAGARAETHGLVESRRLLADESARILPLVEVGALGQSERIRLEQSAAQIETQGYVLTEREAALTFAIHEITAKIESESAQFRNVTFTERATVLQEIAELTERLPALERRVAQAALVAPVTGTVNAVLFDGAGAIVGAGDAVVEIVPADGGFHVEALILPEDIANVEPGQKVRISLTAYDAAKYGTLDGEVVKVSADASFEDEIEARAFKVETTIPAVLVLSETEDVPVRAGMIAQVDIIRGERSILEYLWKPVVKMRDTALRE